MMLLKYKNSGTEYSAKEVDESTKYCKNKVKNKR